MSFSDNEFLQSRVFVTLKPSSGYGDTLARRASFRLVLTGGAKRKSRWRIWVAGRPTQAS